MKTVGIQPHEFRPDRELVTLVLQALKRNRFIQANTINVGLTQGWVTLMGEVDCASQRQLAEATVRAVDGVIGVTNRIVIRSRTPQVYAVTDMLGSNAIPASHLPSRASSSCSICLAPQPLIVGTRSESQLQTGSDQDLQLEE